MFSGDIVTKRVHRIYKAIQQQYNHPENEKIFFNP
jgi:hypothetical protein